MQPICRLSLGVVDAFYPPVLVPNRRVSMNPAPGAGKQAKSNRRFRRQSECVIFLFFRMFLRVCAVWMLRMEVEWLMTVASSSKW